MEMDTIVDHIMEITTTDKYLFVENIGAWHKNIFIMKGFIS